jgi:hypothetical protein
MAARADAEDPAGSNTLPAAPDPKATEQAET